MNDTEVAVAALGVAGTAIGGVIWVVKYLAETLSSDLKAHTKASVEAKNASKALAKTVEKVGAQAELSAKNSEQQLKFMKELNGKLVGATRKTIKENTYER